MERVAFKGKFVGCNDDAPHEPHVVGQYNTARGWLDEFCTGREGDGISIAVTRRIRGHGGDADVFQASVTRQG